MPGRSFAGFAALLLLATPWLPASADPFLANPDFGTLELVTPDPAEQAKLRSIDGLAFDDLGNLFGVLEITGPAGGVVYIDVDTGAVTVLTMEISRADQIAFHPSGDFFVTSEVNPGSTFDRVFRVTPLYDPTNVPTSATSLSLVTSDAIDNPEGLVVLDASGAYGIAGDLYVAEDRTPGRILHVDPTSGMTTTLASGLTRAEGMAFGDFGGALPAALYVAETGPNQILQIASDGTVSNFGDPSTVAFVNPDNVEFGPDGFLYVSLDRHEPNSLIIRIAADGTYEVFASGFGNAQGMIFDPDTADLYISEQQFDRVWRVRASCADGVDNDGDGRVDFGDDPGCDSEQDRSERSAALVCDDGVDNDGDGRIDFDPVTFNDPSFQAGVGDPGCPSPVWSAEDPACQDGGNNDGQLGTDFDGGESVLGVGNGDPAGPRSPRARLRANGAASGRS